MLTLGMQKVKTFREVFALLESNLFNKDITTYCICVEMFLVWLGKIIQMMILVLIRFPC